MIHVNSDNSKVCFSACLFIFEISSDIPKVKRKSQSPLFYAWPHIHSSSIKVCSTGIKTTPPLSVNAR